MNSLLEGTSESLRTLEPVTRDLRESVAELKVVKRAEKELVRVSMFLLMK
jgi:hypothetical protein